MKRPAQRALFDPAGQEPLFTVEECGQLAAISDQASEEDREALTRLGLWARS